MLPSMSRKFNLTYNQYSLLYVAGFSMLTLSAGCDQQKITPVSKDDIVSSKFVRELECSNYGTHRTPFGNLQNNVWNEEAAGEFPWIQCIAERLDNNETQYGWFWSWPFQKSTTIFSKPQITTGQSPWANHLQPSPGYPLPIASLKNLTIHYDMDIRSKGDLNITTTLWVTNSATIPAQAEIDSIVAEVVIWTYATDNFYERPSGTKIGEFAGPGQQWEVWLQKNWHGSTGQTDYSWTYIAFRSKNQQLKASSDLIPILSYCFENRILEKENFIADIQLGNAILRGSGEAWLREFGVEIETNKDDSSSL